jgi:plasmid stabilization system protein ParE
VPIQREPIHMWVALSLSAKLLKTFPQRGHKRDDVLPGLRIIGFERRVTIAFVVTADAVLIEGILYGGRDIPAAFRATD